MTTMTTETGVMKMMTTAEKVEDRRTKMLDHNIPYISLDYTPYQSPYERMGGQSSSGDDSDSGCIRPGDFCTCNVPTVPEYMSIFPKKTEAKDIFPKVSRVVFNDPVTKVWFDDGTNSLVRCSKGDSFSKDAGLAFAILKRLFGTIDDRYQAQSDGYMCELSRIIKGAYDQKKASEKKASGKKDTPKKPAGGAKENQKGAKKNSKGKKS